MPASPLLDLTKLKTWCGCRPGMTRALVMAALQSEEAEVKADEDNNLTATKGEWDVGLSFAKDNPELLRQLSMDDDDIFWAGQPIMNARVDEALQTMASSGAAWWTQFDAIAQPDTEPVATAETLPTDEELLSEGTIWFPKNGFGLVIWSGVVMGVVWRSLHDLPKHFSAPVTETQRALSSRPDLEDFLRKQKQKRTRGKEPKDATHFLRWAATVAAFAMLAFTVREGFKEKTLWDSAPTVTAKFVAGKRGRSKQFAQYLPAPVQRLLPSSFITGTILGNPPSTDLYGMEFTDEHNRQQLVWLEGAEFYVTPQTIGGEEELTVRKGDPLRVKGPARARDAALLEYAPWAISIGAMWLFAQLLVSCLPFLFRLLRRANSKLLLSEK